MEKRKRFVGRRVARLGKLLLLAAVASGIVYWWRFAPVKVVKTPVGKGEIVAEVMGTGTLEAHIRATISPKISGLITKVLVDQGDQVKAGQVLAQLDDGDLKQQVAIAEASLAAATAALDRMRADKARAEAVLDQAKRYRQRIETSSTTGAVAKVDLDKAMESLGVAEAEIHRADAAITEGEKQIAAAQQTLEYHRARLTDTVIKAPFDGLIVRRDRDPGAIVVPGSCIVAMISQDEIWASAWVDETEMARLTPGQPARVIFRSEPSRSYKGEVSRLGREADRETREFVVDVLVRELPKNWAVGQRAEVYIETARRGNTVILPSSRLVWRDSGPGVFVENQGHASWRPLRPGLRGMETVEVLDGLREGESIIVPADPKTALSEGQRVKSR